MVDTAPTPAIEPRVASLERGERDTAGTIARLERKLDEVITQVTAVRIALAQRRGAERVGAWLLDTVKLLAAGVAGAWASHRFGGIL